MARKPIEQPSSRSEAFLSGKRPLQLSDLTEEEKQSAFDAISKHTMSTRAQLENFSTEEKLNHKSPIVRQKAKRSKKALDEGAVDKPYSHEDAITSHMEHFKNSVLNSRQGEAIHGVDFYTQNAEPVHESLEGHHVDPVTAFGSTSKLSYNNTPDNEKASLKSLLDAHERGSVTYTPEMVNKVHSVIEGSHKIPLEDIGKTVPFSQVHPQVVAAMTDPKIREDVSHAVKNVNLNGIGLGGQRKNISAAHGVLQTGNPIDPYTNPKFASYTLSHAEAPRVNSPEHQEYNMRAAHIHDVYTGKVSADQGMFDFYGLRNSNEGHLSNEAPTPIDMHHKRMAYTQPAGAPYAASGDLSMSAKGNVATGDTKVTAAGVEHAVLQDAVHQAAKRIQTKNKLQFTVPSRMVNEASWANTRVMTGDDPDPMKKEQSKAHSQALKEEKTRNKNLSKQLDLFS